MFQNFLSGLLKTISELILNPYNNSHGKKTQTCARFSHKFNSYNSLTTPPVATTAVKPKPAAPAFEAHLNSELYGKRKT